MIGNSKNNCCGCGACEQICPKHCITMRADNEGFIYPVVNVDICIDCHLCENVCPFIAEYNDRKPIKIFAAKCTNEEVRLLSSSGGAFSVIAKSVIEEGGVVFGAKFNQEWEVVHDYTETTEGLKEFRGSKYVQSRIGDSYKKTKDFLIKGRKVLFSGTPCQIAGLKKFLGKEYETLLTVDIVCHGVPSYKVWQTYLGEIVDGGKIEHISFRNKEKGWRNYSLVIKTNEQEYAFPMEERTSSFMKGFLKELFLRQSCYNCKVKRFRSQSDITLADYWWIKNVVPDFDDNKGVSLTFINSKKGMDVFDSLDMVTTETDTDAEIKAAYLFSGAVCHSAKYNKKRDVFFKKLGNEKFPLLVNELTRPTLNERIYLALRDLGRKNDYMLSAYKKYVKPLIKRNE